jgi:hypothetical protein
MNAQDGYLSLSVKRFFKIYERWVKDAVYELKDTANQG